MGIKLSSVKADLQRENDGEWVPIPEWEGVRFKVRSINYQPFQMRREIEAQKARRQLRRAPIGDEFAPQLAKLVGEFILLGVEGLIGDDDKPIVISTPAEAIAWLSPPDMRPIVQQIIWAASYVGDKEAEFTDEAIKNSAAPSASI